MTRSRSCSSRPSRDIVAPLLFGAALALLAHGCSAPVAGDRFTVHAPASAQFPPVGALLERRCGTLDCHGSTSRNLRLWGHDGLRLDPTAVSGAGDTTTEEFIADYHSVVGLEPEVLTAVVHDGGAHPERLTLVRKARGLEKHYGGAQVVAGDDGDVCITSWLAGNVNAPACDRASTAR